MAKYRYGLKSMTISDIDADGVTPTNPVDVTKYVYKNTLEVVESEGDVTKHFAEGYTLPSVALKSTGEEVGKVSFFGIPLDLLADLKGGTTTTVDGKSTYAKATQEVNIEKQITFVTKDNVKITYIRTFIDAVQNNKYNDTDVAMVNLTMIPLLPVDGSTPVITEEL